MWGLQLPRPQQAEVALIKIFIFVIGVVIAWVIITQPATAAPFVAGVVKDLALFLQVVLGGLVDLVKQVISLFEAAQKH